MREITFLFPRRREVVKCQIEECGDGSFRVISCYRKLEARCWICGVWKPITEMWRFVEDEEWTISLCSEECYLTYLLGKRNDAGNRAEAEGLHVRV